MLTFPTPFIVPASYFIKKVENVMESLYDRQLGGFTQGLLKSNKKHLIQKFNFSSRYVVSE